MLRVRPAGLGRSAERGNTVGVRAPLGSSVKMYVGDRPFRVVGNRMSERRRRCARGLAGAATYLCASPHEVGVLNTSDRWPRTPRTRADGRR